MTKMLSHLLEAKEPQFRQTISSLESSSGFPCEDIKLSESLRSLCNDKIKELGLDPADTTGEELFHALRERLKNDDALLVKRLRKISAYRVNAAANISEGIAEAIIDVSRGSSLFVLKQTTAKRILSKLPPKKTMKELKYRSVDSLLKHEPVALLIMAAIVIEPSSWQGAYDKALKGLTQRDFEERELVAYAPSSIKWAALGKKLIAEHKQPVLINKEMGCEAILPIPNNPIAGLATMTLAVAASGLNDIFVSSTYLKVNQVTKDFGKRLVQAATEEPVFSNTKWFNTPLSWESIYRFLHYNSMSKGTGINLDTDSATLALSGWQPVEQLVHRIAPEMEFWSNSGHLSRLDGHRIISFNVLDNALSLLNRKLYGHHYIHHAKHSLTQELIARYIKPSALSEYISQDLSANLQPEMALSLDN